VVDCSKRQSLKSLGGMMALPLVPATMILASNQAKAIGEHNSVSDVLNNDALTISLILGDKPFMKVTNNSEKLTILRRINPGVVHAEAKSYDLNQALVGSFYAIGAGGSRTIPITEAGSEAADPSLPISHRHKPLRVASISADNIDGRLLNSSTVFYA